MTFEANSHDRQVVPLPGRLLPGGQTTEGSGALGCPDVWSMVSQVLASGNIGTPLGGWRVRHKYSTRSFPTFFPWNFFFFIRALD